MRQQLPPHRFSPRHQHHAARGASCSYIRPCLFIQPCSAAAVAVVVVAAVVRLKMSSYTRGFSSMSLGGSRARGGLASSYSGARAAGVALPEPAGRWPGTPLRDAHGEREEMQELNKRLAGYLHKVKELEAANATTEANIQELLRVRGAIVQDHGARFAAIADLRSKMLAQVLENARIGLDVDNARLAADDFRCKWETEVALRSSVEADIGNLHMLLDEYTGSRDAMASEAQSMHEELAYMKRNHRERLALSKAQVEGSSVSIQVDSAKGVDLTKMLGDMREQYESLIARSRGQAEEAFRKQLESVKVQSFQQDQAASAAKAELAEVRRTMQGLTVELESLMALLGSLEEQLRQTEHDNARELSSHGDQIGALQGRLHSVHGATNAQLRDYSELLNMKMKLEQEIGTYRRLLEGEESSPVIPAEATKEEVKKRKKVVITQTIVDGEVINTSEEVSESNEKS
uniref:LOW QUALITY PROTEIN: keratin, type 1 cytoskeletal 11-like n=1 Tax=Petromyzon marinus TaxID=7757 RepID=A0AAJ7WZL5_PETMA|nr:LOW QUALITY PROTEIN: keratin, type 1 cytoskeletal 11-like [Petromyzon marinus]